MTRTKTIATLWCTALAATLAAYGCGSSSTIDTGTGGGPGTAGKSGGQGGNGIVIINTGGMTGSGGITGGGLGGMTGGGQGGMVMPPVDAGPPACANGNMCTAGFTCEMACRANGVAGTRTCTCGNNNRINCNAPPCITPDAGAPPPPPPVDAGPAVDAGPLCAAGVNTGTNCVVGTSVSPCTRRNGGQTCTCALPPAVDAGAPADAGPDAAVPPPPPPRARYTCM